jgi:Fe-S-cluster containining protein
VAEVQGLAFAIEKPDVDERPAATTCFARNPHDRIAPFEMCVLRRRSMPNPCLSCGACCSCYRVSFHWSEAEPFMGGTTPAELTTQVSPHRIAMRGTSGASPRCVALEGRVGEAARCSIYARRPSPCREFEVSWEHGVRSEGCDRARAAHGLPPLVPPKRRAPRKRAAG